MVQLVGYDNFVRSNPLTDRFEFRAFHHVEFLCGDAQTTASRWAAALGLDLVARSNVSTGNSRFSSHIVQSGDVCFVFTAPTSSGDAVDAAIPTASLSPAAMQRYIAAHGLAVFAVGVQVADAREAFDLAVRNGAKPHAPPRAAERAPECVVSEVLLHADGDAVLRFISGADALAGAGVLPGYEAVPRAEGTPGRFGFTRMDHIVSNVPRLLDAVEYVMNATGWHEFAEFTAEGARPATAIGARATGGRSGLLGSGARAEAARCSHARYVAPFARPHPALTGPPPPPAPPRASGGRRGHRALRPQLDGARLEQRAGAAPVQRADERGEAALPDPDIPRPARRPRRAAHRPQDRRHLRDRGAHARVV